MMEIRAGVAVVDITPPAGLPMAGFAARTGASVGTHDPLTVRALAIGDTAVLVADVIGIEGAMSARIRARCALADERVVVAALHNHGGPVSMAGRVGAGFDAAWAERLEAACVEAIDRAVAGAQPARLFFGTGVDPGVARNRRHPGGPVDGALPVLEVRGADGTPIAVCVSYACHPVVLDATNRLWTADYPHFVRARIEAARPGARALFFTGCTGDVNTGHSAAASVSLAADPRRSFAQAERIGGAIADAVLAADMAPVGGSSCGAAAVGLCLALERRETKPPDDLAARWRDARETADAAHRAMFDAWTAWAGDAALRPCDPVDARVSVLRWGDVAFVALPGEVFARTALDIRGVAGPRAFVVSYAEDNPGYIPPAGEFRHGGYEVEEAHRYYGLPASFAPGSAEALAEAALEGLRAVSAGGS